MQKKIAGVLMAFFLVGQLAAPGFTEDLKGRFGVTGSALAGFPLGQQSVKDQADNLGPIVGGMASYGLTSHWGVGASYENYDVGGGLRVEPIVLQGIYHFCPQKSMSPTLLLGGGLSRGVDAKNFHHAVAKAGLGVEHFFGSQFSVGPQVNYYYVANTQDSPRLLNAIGVGLTASYYFGKAAAKSEEKAAPAQAEAAPAPAVIPAAIALAIVPATAVLGQGQTQSFAASVTGATNSGVTWSISPNLGTIDANGLYTAPASVALPEHVTITATSIADGSKMTTSSVQLNPPTDAPHQVSIALDVLFDTGKSNVKPEFHGDIQHVADFMKSYPSAQAEIEGHTDSTGSATSNTTLSQQRADSVRQVLITEFGIDGARLTAKGYGPSRPIASNDTKEGRATNRRVVATLTATK